MLVTPGTSSDPGADSLRHKQQTTTENKVMSDKINSLASVEASRAFQKLSVADQAQVKSALKDASPEQLASYFGKSVDDKELRSLLPEKLVQARVDNPHFIPFVPPAKPMFASVIAEVSCHTQY